MNFEKNIFMLRSPHDKNRTMLVKVESIKNGVVRMVNLTHRESPRIEFPFDAFKKSMLYELEDGVRFRDIQRRVKPES